MTSSPSSLRTLAMEVLSILRSHGHEAYFAGGCVRDRALGITPKDYDIASSARPEEVLACFPKAIPVGIQFGVVRVVHHQIEFEVATFRADGDYADGRHPSSVRWASAREDVLRRDFTINGLLEDPFAPEGSQIVDFVQGLSDLERGLIRAIGDPKARFEEDYLRILRAVRFSARFGFPIEADTFAAMQACVGGISHVSAERISAELLRILEEGGAALGFQRLRDSGLISFVLPELAALGEEALVRAYQRLLPLSKASAVVGLALLCWELPGSLESLGQRLRLSRQLTRDTQELRDHAQALLKVEQLSLADKKRHIRGPLQPLILETLRCVGASAQREQLLSFLSDRSVENLNPAPLLNGQDLKAEGYKPGPTFRAILEDVETAQLNEDISTREEALALAKAHAFK